MSRAHLNGLDRIGWISMASAWLLIILRAKLSRRFTVNYCAILCFLNIWAIIRISNGLVFVNPQKSYPPGGSRSHNTRISLLLPHFQASNVTKPPPR